MRFGGDRVDNLYSDAVLMKRYEYIRRLKAPASTVKRLQYRFNKDSVTTLMQSELSVCAPIYANLLWSLKLDSILVRRYFIW